MDQFGRFNFRINDWLRHLSFLPDDIDFSDDRPINLETFISPIAMKVRSLELCNSAAGEAISFQPEEDDLL
jgi:hypothetical protein